jgi:hypothetical protein
MKKKRIINFYKLPTKKQTKHKWRLKLKWMINTPKDHKGKIVDGR